MGNSCRIFIAVILIISLFTVSVFATPTGTYDLYSTNGRVISGYTGSGNDYITNFSSHLAHIQVYLNQILSYNANISTTIDYYLPALLQRMVDAFSPAAGDTRSMWQLSSAMVSGITAIQSAALGIAQDVYNINTNTADIDRLAGLIHSDVDQVESQLTSINTNLNTLTSKYNWYDRPVTFNGISDDNVNFSLDSHKNGNTLYSKITLDSNFYSTSQHIFYVRIPAGLYYLDLLDSVELLVSDNNNVKLLYYDVGFYYTELYIYMNVGNNYLSDITVKYNLSNITNLYYRSNMSTFLKYINTSTYGFYDFMDHLAIMSLEQKSNSNLSDIKNILIDIDNNSDFIQNNNDLQINVDIDASDGQGITAIISKLQDLFDFGVGLQEFLVTLNEFDNLHWFTRVKTYEQVNYDPRDNVGYQNLYD